VSHTIGMVSLGEVDVGSSNLGTIRFPRNFKDFIWVYYFPRMSLEFVQEKVVDFFLTKCPGSRSFSITNDGYSPDMA
jgi:hypothetical protein